MRETRYNERIFSLFADFALSQRDERIKRIKQNAIGELLSPLYRGSLKET